MVCANEASPPAGPLLTRDCVLAFVLPERAFPIIPPNPHVADALVLLPFTYETLISPRSFPLCPACHCMYLACHFATFLLQVESFYLQCSVDSQRHCSAFRVDLVGLAL